jgi:hypothetical protein
MKQILMFLGLGFALLTALATVMCPPQTLR